MRLEGGSLVRRSSDTLAARRAHRSTGGRRGALRRVLEPDQAAPLEAAQRGVRAAGPARQSGRAERRRSRAPRAPRAGARPAAPPSPSAASPAGVIDGPQRALRAQRPRGARCRCPAGAPARARAPASRRTRAPPTGRGATSDCGTSASSAAIGSASRSGGSSLSSATSTTTPSRRRRPNGTTSMLPTPTSSSAPGEQVVERPAQARAGVSGSTLAITSPEATGRGGTAVALGRGALGVALLALLALDHALERVHAGRVELRPGPRC